jgi:hypothetical protein
MGYSTLQRSFAGLSSGSSCSIYTSAPVRRSGSLRLPLPLDWAARLPSAAASCPVTSKSRFVPISSSSRFVPSTSRFRADCAAVPLRLYGSAHAVPTQHTTTICGHATTACNSVQHTTTHCNMLCATACCAAHGTQCSMAGTPRLDVA